MPAIPVTMNWRIILSQQQNLRRLIPFYVETAVKNLHIRNIKKAAALIAMQDLIQSAVYMRIFISAVPMQRIRNNRTGLRKVRKCRTLIFRSFLICMVSISLAVRKHAAEPDEPDQQILHKELWYNRNTFAIINTILRTEQK